MRFKYDHRNYNRLLFRQNKVQKFLVPWAVEARLLLTHRTNVRFIRFLSTGFHSIEMMIRNWERLHWPKTEPELAITIAAKWECESDGCLYRADDTLWPGIGGGFVYALEHRPAEPMSIEKPPFCWLRCCPIEHQTENDTEASSLESFSCVHSLSWLSTERCYN